MFYGWVKKSKMWKILLEGCCSTPLRVDKLHCHSNLLLTHFEKKMTISFFDKIFNSNFFVRLLLNEFLENWRCALGVGLNLRTSQLASDANGSSRMT